MIVDGWIIPEDPSTCSRSGRQNPVDVLVGSNKDDLSFGPARPATPEQFEQAAAPRWGALADQFLKLYPHATDEEASKSQADTSNDGAFWHMRLFADYQKKQGRQAWLFYFAQNPPGPAGQPSFPAAHASEIPYVFNNLGKPALFPDPSDPALSAASAPDRKVADQMSSYWANFARTGNPNGAGLPTWQEHQVGASDRAIILDADPSSEKLPAKARLELYDKLYAQMRAHAAAERLSARGDGNGRFGCRGRCRSLRPTSRLCRRTSASSDPRSRPRLRRRAPHENAAPRPFA